jgi:hypothetical protein
MKVEGPQKNVTDCRGPSRPNGRVDVRAIKKPGDMPGLTRSRKTIKKVEQPTFAARSACWPAYRFDSAAAAQGW